MKNLNNYEDYLKKYGVKNPDDPRHHYDYKKAYESGITPKKWKDLPKKDKAEDLRQVSEGLREPISEDAYMWPDIGKTEGHPKLDFSKANESFLTTLKDEPKKMSSSEFATFFATLKDEPIKFGGGISQGRGATGTFEDDLPKIEPMSSHVRMQGYIQKLLPAFYRRQQRREQVIEKGLTNYMKYAQPAFKWAVSGMPEEEPERFMKMSWADVIRESYPVLSDPESPLARSVAVQFGAEIAGELLDIGTRPSTYLIWGAAERLIPPALTATFRKLPKGVQQSLIKERFIWGRKPIDLAYKELGLKKGASIKEVGKAYREMAKKWHPDKAPAGQSMKYTHKFLKGQGAYDKIKASTEIIRQSEIINKQMGLPTPKEQMAVIKSVSKQKAPVVKPAWQMTKTELKASYEEKLAIVEKEGKDIYFYSNLYPTDERTLGRIHKEYVSEAIQEGKPVPAEVLAEYPTLAKKIGKVKKPAEVIKGKAREREIPEIKTTKPLITQSQKDNILKKKAIKQKQLIIEKADEAKKLVHSMIRERRFFLNSKNYDTNLFVNSIEQKTSIGQREIMPFVLEKTDIPKELNRPDLIKLYEKEADNLQPIASQIKKHFDDSWRFMQEHSDEISVQQIENYVTHLWEVPKSKKQAITNWFVTQNKFLKKRHIETYKKGIEELGLKPKTLDISEIIRIHDNIMNKAIVNKKFVKELKQLTFEGTPLIARIDKAPEHWVYFDHPALKQGMVIPGKLIAGEKVSEELKTILYEMGVAIGRRISPVTFGKPTQIEGQYRYGETPEIRLQRFFENSTVAHEIGHHLDETLKLGKNFLDEYKDELYAINRDRIESHKGRKGKYGEVYAKSTEEQIAELFAYVFVKPDIAYQKAPNAMADVLGRLKEDDILSKLIDFNFETKAKNLIEEQLNTMVKLPVKVHPDLEKPLKVIFESRFDHEIIRAYEAINGILKKSKLSLSLFHHLALGETSIATTGLVKTLNIYFNPVKIYRAMVKGEFDIFKKEEIARKWIERGLQVGATADIPVARIQRGLNTFKNKTKSIPVLNKLSQFLASFNETWDKALWNYLHDTMKLYGCEALGTKINLTKDIIKQEQEIAQMVNDTFGGQNWDMLMVSPKTLQIATWGLLSPDWTISTGRQALSPTGLGAIHKETARLRKKLGRLFWIKAAIYFGGGINLLNVLFRKNDEKNNPQYYKDQKLTFWDRTMIGNSIGHKTHLFSGRYKSGQERYVRWGKQFRELPEMFYDDTSFSPISASLKKIGGKTAPLFQLGTIISTGVSPSGFRERNIYGKKGWDRTWGIAKTLIESPLPFSTRSIMQRDKEFKLTDLAMPSSKGMSRYKAIDLFKIAIERKDERLFKEVWQDSLRNNIPPYDMFKTSLTILKATNTKEINSKIKTLEDVEKAFPLAKTLKEKNVLRRKKIRLKKEKLQLENGGKFLKKALRELTREDMQISKGKR